MNLPKGVIKSTPDCFVVQELVGQPVWAVPLCERTSIRGPNGYPVTTFNLTKTGMSTEDAAREVARQFGLPFTGVPFFGLKDRHAHTTQIIGVNGKFPSQFEHPQIKLDQIGGRDYPLNPGGNKGNRFTIHVISGARSIDLDGMRSFRHYFGPQRLGEPGSENIGRLLFEGDYQEAARLVVGTKTATTFDRVRARTPSAKAAFLHPRFRFCYEFLLLRWRSFLWNSLLKEFADNDREIPERLPVWDTTLETSDLYRHFWEPKYLCLEATESIHRFSRATIVWPDRLRANRTICGWKIMFDLPAGAYATVALANVFDLEEKHATS